MNFWIKKLVTMVILSAILFTLLQIDHSKFFEQIEKRISFSSEKDEPTDIEPVSEEVAVKKPGSFMKTTSSAAEGLSNFYSKIKQQMALNNKNKKGFVITLDEPDMTLDEVLKQRGAVVKPSDPKFKGTITTRPFPPGKTIRNELSKAAEQDGMELIWRLDRDYVVKYYFEVEADLLSTLDTVANALDSDFENQVYALYCYNQRAIVITHEYTKYAQDQCIEAPTY